MQNLDVNKTNPKNKKIKYEIKKDLEESIMHGERKENIKIKKKVNNVITSESDISDIIWLAYHQRQIFQNLKKKTISQHVVKIWYK